MKVKQAPYRIETERAIWKIRPLEWLLAAGLLGVQQPRDLIVTLIWGLMALLMLWKMPQSGLRTWNVLLIPVDIIVISTAVFLSGGLQSHGFLLYSIDVLFLVTYVSWQWIAVGTGLILVSYGIVSNGWTHGLFWWQVLLLVLLALSAHTLGSSVLKAMRSANTGKVKLEQLAALKSLQGSLVELSDLSTMVMTILQAGTQLLQTRVGYVARWTTSGTLQMVAQVGLSEDEEEWDPRDSYEADALNRTEMTYWKHIASLPPVKVDHGLLALRYYQLALVPLRDGAKVIGVMAFAGDRGGVPLNQQQVVLEGLADMVVNQSRFAQAQSDARKRGRLLGILERVGRIVNKNLEMGMLLRSLHQAVAEELETDSFFVALTLPDDSERILMEYLFDEGQEYPAEVMSITPGSPTERVLEGQEALLIAGDIGPSQLLGSYRVPKSAIFAPLIFEGTIIGVISTQSYRIDYDQDHVEFVSSIASQAAIAIQNAQLYQQTESVALTDHLTNLGNSRRFTIALRLAIDHARATHTALSLLLIDSDSLKQINDRYGHMAGDTHLQMLSHVILRNIRENDTACRYAGDEFVIILPNTRVDEAMSVGERIRREMDGKFAWNDSMIGTTISVGAAQLDSSMSQEELFAAADRAMYEAKQSGKNRVVAVS